MNTKITSEEKKLITVQEFRSEYGLGHNKAYEIVKLESFPKIQVGRKIFVIKSLLDNWFTDNIGSTF